MNIAAGGAHTPSAQLRASLCALALPALALLAACQGETDPGPGGVTVNEAQALDEAAELLDQQRLPSAEAEEPGTEGEAED